MKPAKIITPIVAIIIAAISTFFLTPLKAWKKGTIIIKSVPGVNTITTDTNKSYSPQSCNYISYCYYWWQCYFGTQATMKDPDYAYNGGTLNEIIVTPKS